MRRVVVVAVAALSAGCGGAEPPPAGGGAPSPVTGAPLAGDGGAASGSCLAAVEVEGRTYVWWEPPAGVDVPPPTGPELAAVVPPCGDADLYEGVPTTPSPVRVRALEGVPVEEAVTLDGRVYLADPDDPPAELTAP